MQNVQDLPPVEGGFEAPTGAPREAVDTTAIQGVQPGAAAPVNRAKSPRQAAEASEAEASTLKITPTRLREVAYQLELAEKHRAKALDLLAQMTVGKTGAVVANLGQQAGVILQGEYPAAREALTALADDLAAL